MEDLFSALNLAQSGKRLVIRREVSSFTTNRRRIGWPLEPAAFILDVRSNEFFVRLREVDNTFYHSNDAADPAGHACNNDLDNAFGGIAENELMHPKAAEQDAANACDHFLFSA